MSESLERFDAQGRRRWFELTCAKCAECWEIPLLAAWRCPRNPKHEVRARGPYP